MLRKIKVGWGRRKWKKSLRWLILVGIVFSFVPGHGGVKGNERTDRLTGTVATISDGREMDHVDVLHALCEAERVGDFGYNHPYPPPLINMVR
jgi:hypothetical protein